MRRAFAMSALLLLSAVSGQAQTSAQLDPANYETVLVPIVAKHPTPGALGSLWKTDIWVRNSGSQNAWFTQLRPICNTICTDLGILRGLTTKNYSDFLVPFDQGSILLHVQREFAANIHLQLRVQDLSRQGSTWGVELPVVRESEFLTRTTELLNVPNDRAFRVLLRAYDPGAGLGTAVIVRIFALEGSAVLGEHRLPLDRVTLQVPTPPFPPFPGYAQLVISQDNFPNIAGHARLRLEVSRAVPNMRFWAFATITHNETQQVTTITPQ